MSNRPSWTGGAAAAKPQPGWLFRILKNAPWIFLNEKSINHVEIISVIEQPPRRFAPPLLSRRGDRPMSCKYVLASEFQFGKRWRAGMVVQDPNREENQRGDRTTTPLRLRSARLIQQFVA